MGVGGGISESDAVEGLRESKRRVCERERERVKRERDVTNPNLSERDAMEGGP